MTIPAFQTPRLILRGTQPSDLEHFLQMLAKREVIRFLIQTEPWPRERVEKWLEASSRRWKEDGVGFWILELKATRQPIGWCGLNKLPETGEVELLYALDQPWWGQGLATEAARFSLAYGFETARLPEVIGLVVPGNLASARVLEKSGLRFTGQAPYFGHNLLRYLIQRGDPRESAEAQQRDRRG